MAKKGSARKKGPPPTASCPCKHPSHNAMRCGKQMGVDQEVCAECKDHYRQEPPR